MALRRSNYYYGKQLGHCIVAKMYDRPYNKLDIGQLPQIAVVDSFYHGLVCESP